jgi:hypothetical protein
LQFFLSIAIYCYVYPKEIVCRALSGAEIRENLIDRKMRTSIYILHFTPSKVVLVYFLADPYKTKNDLKIKQMSMYAILNYQWITMSIYGQNIFCLFQQCCKFTIVN